MLKQQPLYILLVLLALPFAACNKEDKSVDEVSEFDYASTMVRTFSLGNDKSVLENLDTVFFSIDQVNARIFNANPLPYGTRVNKLTVDLTVDGCSVVQISYPTDNGVRTIDYLKSTTDSIDFSRGPVTLHLVSYDGTAQRDYQIEVNVFETRPDRFTWTDLTRGTLPTLLPSVTAQRTVARGEQAYCLTSDGSSYCVSVLDPARFSDWLSQIVEFDFEPDVRSFTATEDAFYMLDCDGMLYTSDDLMSWTSTGETWSHIYGPYGNSLVGVVKNGSKYYHATYPGGIREAVVADMPVSGTSQPIRFVTKWSARPQMLMRGGRTASGRVIGDVYGYDGNSWARVSRPESTVSAIENAMLVPYYVSRTDSSSWVVSERTVLLSTGGVNARGVFDDRMFVSYDMGLSWEIGDTYMALPGSIPDYIDADALVFSTTMYESDNNRSWTPEKTNELPEGALLLADRSSRAVTPITEWDCPMIYIFGGNTTERFRAGVYRGYLNLLTFKPVQ